MILKACAGFSRKGGAGCLYMVIKPACEMKSSGAIFSWPLVRDIPK